MLRYQNLFLSFAASFLLASCGIKRGDTNETATNKTAKDTVRKAPPATVLPKGAVEDEALQAVYLKYIELTEALTAEDMAKARLSSNAIEAGASHLSGGRKLASTAAKITVAPNLEMQRTHFAAMSNEMIDLIKKTGTSKGEIYVDYCPMALNDKGAYWLSVNKEIRNPYFGDKMLTCGEVKETIQ